MGARRAASAAPLRAAAALALLAILTAACAASPPPRSSGADPSPSRAPVLSLEALDVEPIERREESIGFAFDADAAADLLTEVPAQVEFDTHAVVCVFLGPRMTTGWSLDLRTAALRDGELWIRARETAPRGTTRAEVTYPADCGLLNRGALPVGDLMVRADDTITDEFITRTVVEVPERSGAP